MERKRKHDTGHMTGQVDLAGQVHQVKELVVYFPGDVILQIRNVV